MPNDQNLMKDSETRRPDETKKDEISQEELSEVSGGTVFRIPTSIFNAMLGR